MCARLLPAAVAAILVAGGRRPAGPKSLLVAFYGCINKSDKSLMLGPFMAFQPDCLIIEAKAAAAVAATVGGGLLVWQPRPGNKTRRTN